MPSPSLSPSTAISSCLCSGKLYMGFLPTETAFNDPDFQTVLRWADKVRESKQGH